MYVTCIYETAAATAAPSVSTATSVLYNFYFALLFAVFIHAACLCISVSAWPDVLHFLWAFFTLETCYFLGGFSLALHSAQPKTLAQYLCIAKAIAVYNLCQMYIWLPVLYALPVICCLLACKRYLFVLAASCLTPAARY